MKTLVRALPLVLSVATLSCGETTLPPVTEPPVPSATSAAPTAAPEVDESFRKTPPQADGTITFRAPKVHEEKLANGMRVLTVEQHELPIVAVTFATRRGADQAAPGHAALLAALLRQGTKKRSALVFDDALKEAGASLSAWTSQDALMVSGKTLTARLPTLLELLAESLTGPALDKAELEREKTSRLTSIAQQADQPSTLLWKTTYELLYPGGHPYGSLLLGDEASVRKVQKADLDRLYASLVGPDDAVLAFAGDVTPVEAKAHAERLFGAWKGKQKKRVEPPAPKAPDPKSKRVVLVERPGASQSQIAIALHGVPRKHPDFEAILVMNTILGGQFSSRLNLSLREKHAYTYGARSSFDMRLGPGPFSASAAVVTQHTAAALREALAEIERMRTTLVTDDELGAARENLIAQLPARFESASETATTLASLAIYDLPLDELATRPARIAKVTSADVKRVAEKHLDASSRFVVVVGDPSVAPSLRELGLGELDVRAPAKKKDDKKDDKKASKGGAEKPNAPAPKK
jgi:zinc protease